MSITPTTSAPAIKPAHGRGARDATAPGDFLALVQQALTETHSGRAPAETRDDRYAGHPDGHKGTAKGGSKDTASASGAAAEDQATADPAPTADTNAPTEVLPAALALPVAPPAGPAALATVDPSTTGPGTVPGAAVGAAADAQPGAVSGAVAGAVSGTPDVAGAASDASAGGTATAGPHTTGHSARPVAGDASGSARLEPSAEGDRTAPATTTTSPSAHAGGTGADTSSGEGSQSGPGTPAPPSVVPAAPTAPVATTPTAAPTTAPSGAPAQPVAGQVFPEVTSLVSRGDGTHRITLTLKPEALGEVRVVMTVRDGAVHVRLAAGHDAQQALLSGSSELSRLLEHAGATETRIVVRDLPAGPAPVAGASGDSGADLGSSLGQAPGSGLGAGSSQPQDQHAGTRAEHTAMDGEPDTGTETLQSRPVQPVTRARTSGVDVTM